MTTVLVGSTIPAFKMDDTDGWQPWLSNAAAITTEAKQAGVDVTWLVVCQEDQRGRSLFKPVLKALFCDHVLVHARTIWFSLDTGATEVTSGNRLGAICTGRNLIINHALEHGHDWIYFADADISAPDDILVRLLELDSEVCGAHVPTYCLDGQQTTHPGDVREHWNTAGSLLVKREVFRRIPWRYDPDAGCTDDPATQHEMKELGYPTLVRHDVVCTHHPAMIAGLEDRGHDLAVYR